MVEYPKKLNFRLSHTYIHKTTSSDKIQGFVNILLENVKKNNEFFNILLPPPRYSSLPRKGRRQRHFLDATFNPIDKRQGFVDMLSKILKKN